MNKSRKTKKSLIKIFMKNITLIFKNGWTNTGNLYFIKK